MTLINSLSALKQSLYASIPPSLGVKQYQSVIIQHEGIQYPFVAKILELAPGQKISYMNMGVRVNNETRLIEGIPFNVPEDAMHHGTYLYGGIKADVVSIQTNGTVSFSAIVQEFRDR